MGYTPRASNDAPDSARPDTLPVTRVTHAVLRRSFIDLMSALRRRPVVVSAMALGLAIAGAGTAVALNSSSGETPGVGRSQVARSSPCPAQQPYVFHTRRDSADRWLVPPGTDQVLLCRYDGPFGGPSAHVTQRFRLIARQVILDHGHATQLAAELDRLPEVPSGGLVGCAKRTATIVAFFRYATGPVDPVSVDLAGCMTATNGDVTREAGIGDATILNKLEALIHAEPTRSPGSQTGSATMATIAGYVWLCGGPAPGRCFASTIGGCAPPDGCSRSDRVVAIDSAGEIVAEQRLRFPYPNGRFRLLVPPGQYAVELLADGPRIHDQLMQTQGATARARHSTKVVFTFDIP